MMRPDFPFALDFVFDEPRRVFEDPCSMLCSPFSVAYFIWAAAFKMAYPLGIEPSASELTAPHLFTRPVQDTSVFPEKRRGKVNLARTTKSAHRKKMLQGQDSNLRLLR